MRMIKMSIKVEEVDESRILGVCEFLSDQIAPLLRQQLYLAGPTGPNILDALLYAALTVIQTILPKNHDWNLLVTGDQVLHNYLERLENIYF